jgi:hypothetical protein
MTDSSIYKTCTATLHLANFLCLPWGLANDLWRDKLQLDDLVICKGTHLLTPLIVIQHDVTVSGHLSGNNFYKDFHHHDKFRPFTRTKN